MVIVTVLPSKGDENENKKQNLEGPSPPSIDLGYSTWNFTILLLDLGPNRRACDSGQTHCMGLAGCAVFKMVRQPKPQLLLCEKYSCVRSLRVGQIYKVKPRSAAVSPPT